MRFLIAVAATVLLLAGTGSQAAPTVRAAADDDRTVTLTITGGSGMWFAGSCRLDTATGSRVVSFDAEVPFTRDFEARGLSCRFVKKSGPGPLVVEVRRSSRLVVRSVTGTTGGLIVVSVE